MIFCHVSPKFDEAATNCFGDPPRAAVPTSDHGEGTVGEDMANLGKHENRLTKQRSRQWCPTNKE